jgi:hypothetical protein
VLTDRCIDFIEASKDERWCAYLSHLAVHTPLHAKLELHPKYQEKAPGKLRCCATPWPGEGSGCPQIPSERLPRGHLLTQIRHRAARGPARSP